MLAALAVLERATATEVGQHSAQHKTKVSRAVRTLEAKRWLKREPDEDDRRSEFLLLTPAGMKAYKDLAAPLLKRENEILALLPDDDRAAFMKGLAAMEKVMGLSGQYD